MPFDIYGPHGPEGPQGDPGTTGDAGADGLGVPAGGTDGQVLTKLSATDNDTDWETPGGAAAPTISHSLHSIASANGIMSNIGVAEVEIFLQQRGRVIVDMDNVTQVRAMAGVFNNSNINATAALKIQYSTDAGSTWADLTTGALLDIPGIAGISGAAVSTWQAKPVGAVDDVLVRAVVYGGDDVADVNLQNVQLQVK